MLLAASTTMSFSPLSPRSVRDGRHNRYESYTEPHVYDRVEYWQRKREKWRAEKDTAADSNDAFASGGLFAGFGQHSSRRAASTQQQTALTAVTAGRVGVREQHRDRASLQPPTLFPSINSHRFAQPQPATYHSSRSPRLSPLSAQPPPSYMSGVHELHGGPTADQQLAKREAQRSYQATLQQQMRDNEERKRREKREAEERDRREEEEARNYNPFGRGGGGAPMRDSNGHIMANRTQALAHALSPAHHYSSTSAPASQPSQQSAALGGFTQPVGRGRVGLRSDDANMAARQQADKQQWQQTLAQQIEEKASKKRREEEQRRDEDRREEERLQKERVRMDEEWRVERGKEQLKQKALQDEQENKARKTKSEEGLTDYEREQAMKGRRAPQPQQAQQQPYREEERKETVLSSSVQSSPAAATHHQSIAPHSSVQSRGLAFTYDELEHELERLRADIRHESDAARARRIEKQRQKQQWQGGSQVHQPATLRRRQRVAALDEDDDTNIARFLNKQPHSWQTQAVGLLWQHDEDGVSLDSGRSEVYSDVGGGAQLAGSSTFIPLPANYDSRLATPEAQLRPSSQQQRSQRQSVQWKQAQSEQVVAASIQLLPPPPPPPASRPSAVDDRPLPALTKQNQQVDAPATERRSEQTADTRPATDGLDDDEQYADDKFVVEAEEDAQPTKGDEHHDGNEQAAGTEEEVIEDEVVEDEQYGSHQPSEYSKLVSETDLRDDDLDWFVINETDHDSGHTVDSNKNGRKRWRVPTAGQATPQPTAAPLV